MIKIGIEGVSENSSSTLEDILKLELSEIESVIKELKIKFNYHPSKFGCLIILLGELAHKIYDRNININQLETPLIEVKDKLKIDLILDYIEPIINESNYFEKREEIWKYRNNIENLELYFSKRYILKIAAILKFYKIEYYFLKPLLDFIPLSNTQDAIELSPKEFDVLSELITLNLRIDIYDISSLIIIYYKFGALDKLNGLIDFSFCKYSVGSSRNKLNPIKKAIEELSNSLISIKEFEQFLINNHAFDADTKIDTLIELTINLSKNSFEEEALKMLEILNSQEMSLSDYYNILLNISIETKLFDKVISKQREYLNTYKPEIRPIDTVIIQSYEFAKYYKNTDQISEDLLYELLEIVINESKKLGIVRVLGNPQIVLPYAIDSIILSAITRFGLPRTAAILNFPNFLKLLEEVRKIPRFSNVGNLDSLNKSNTSFEKKVDNLSIINSSNSDFFQNEIDNVFVYMKGIRNLPELIYNLVNYLNLFLENYNAEDRVQVIIDHLIYVRKIDKITQGENQPNASESFLDNSERLKIMSIVFIYIFLKRVEISISINKNILDEDQFPSFLKDLKLNETNFKENFIIKMELTKSLIREFVAYSDLVQITQPLFVNKLKNAILNKS